MDISEKLKARLILLRDANLLTMPHYHYLVNMRESLGAKPKVIFDIGASVLHWVKAAKFVWPDAKYVVFEAMEECEFIYQEQGLDYNIGVLSNKDGRVIEFFQNDENPGGNSYYRENVKLSPDAAFLFSDEHKKTKIASTLDTIIQFRNFPQPDLMKIDVQGAELDVLNGAVNTLKGCRDLVNELQHDEYNIGAPHRDQVIEYLNSQGYDLVTPLFSRTMYDGDYHFKNRNIE